MLMENLLSADSTVASKLSKPMGLVVVMSVKFMARDERKGSSVPHVTRSWLQGKNIPGSYKHPLHSNVEKP